MEGLIRDFSAAYLIEWLLLSAILAFGCYAIHTDIHWRRIPNWATWGLLVIGLAGHAAFWALGASDVQLAGLVFLVGLGVSLALFLWGFWAPGDAKLYWAVMVALPPTLYRSRTLLSLEWVGWALLLNALLINLVVVVLSGAHQRFSATYAGGPGDAVPRKRIWELAVDTAGLAGWITGCAGSLLAEPLRFIHAAIAILVGYLILDRVVPRAYRVAVAVPGLLVGGYTAWATAGLPVVASLWAFAWLSFLVHDALRARLRRSFRQEMDLRAAAAGMTPCASIWGQPDGDGETRWSSGDEVAASAQDVICQPGRALDEGTARKLRDLAARGQFSGFGTKIVMETSTPMAPAIVSAGAITALLGGSLVGPLVDLASLVMQRTG